MKIATFNVNSVRVRLEILLDWLAENEPDALALQEIKCENDKFPTEAFLEVGYHAAVLGQKSYNGVAILTKEPLSQVQYGFGDPTWPEDCRILRGTVGGVRIINTYVPNGTKVGSEKWDYKLRWLEKIAELIHQELQANPNLVWLGDINVAPTADDVYDHTRLLGQVCHHPEEFSRLENIVKDRLVDVYRAQHSGAGHFTYWELFIKSAFPRNLGWRIDHIYASPSLAERCVNTHIDKGPRALERPSDHTVVVAEFDL